MKAGVLCKILQVTSCLEENWRLSDRSDKNRDLAATIGQLVPHRIIWVFTGYLVPRGEWRNWKSAKRGSPVRIDLLANALDVFILCSRLSYEIQQRGI